MKRFLPIAAIMAIIASANADARDISQYIDWGPTTHDFPDVLEKWTPGEQLSPDDNFFISRVKPRKRFRNLATQVHQYLTEDVDKNLIYWVPAGTPPHNALQSDSFDCDIFSMWSYVTHFGNWSAPLARIPGNFADAAHRNGVGVSPVLGIPWGALTKEWGITLRNLLAVGPEKMADFLEYYGIDGLGYNSEFSIYNNLPANTKPESVQEISDFNAAITRIAREKGNPTFMNIWYDGTATNGNILFDQGLRDHNYDTFGREGNEASSLFLNYNWNIEALLRISSENARSIGRNPLDLYAGFNMQGGEPAKGVESWSLLKDYPISIGLWGAHSESMMYESRREAGTSPLAIQQNYLQRTEWWFSGGKRNPASAPQVSDLWNYSGQNTKFFGMAQMMSARSSLTEPFVTNFNLGNGLFFNYKGRRTSDTQWGNIGMQDILPTWRFWWSGKLLGGEKNDVLTDGLDASFTWDDAWIGGSSLRISGSVPSTEYLHLFKTEIPIHGNDRLTLRYKHLQGKTNMRLIVSKRGAEEDAIMLPAAIAESSIPNADWHEVSYTISEFAPGLDGEDLALVALQFDQAYNLDLLLGGFGIIRGEAQTPATPVISHTELLAAGSEGVDGKIIWEMPNGANLRYNDEQNVSFFRLYAQQEGCEPVLQSGTSSWAGLLLGVPVNTEAPMRIRFGVGAVGTDFNSESDIAWDDWHDFSDSYTMSHSIMASAHEVAVGETAIFGFKDPSHPDADWRIYAEDGNEVLTGENCRDIKFTPTAAGSYSLVAEYPDAEGNTTHDTYPYILTALPTSVAKAPIITDFRWTNNADNTLLFSYEATPGEGVRSRGLKLDGNAFGVPAAQLNLKGGKDFSVAFWICPEEYTNEETHLLSIRDKSDSWANNEWGWLWSTIGKEGRGLTVSLRRKGTAGNMELHFPEVTLMAGAWNHLAFSFQFSPVGDLIPTLYWNGHKSEVAYYIDGEKRVDGAPAVIQNLYNWRTGNMISVGGTLFKAGGVEGVLDDFCYLSAALTDSSAEALAKGETLNTEGIAALWSFQNEAGTDNTFANEITDSQIPEAKAGQFRYTPQLKEGSGKAQYVAPVFAGGAPILNGTQISTEVRWEAHGASEINPEGNAASGRASVKYQQPGNYNVTLTISNLCGSDSRRVVMIHIPDESGITTTGSGSKAAATGMVTIAPRGMAILTFDTEGRYAVQAVTLDGKVVFSKEITVCGSSYVLENLPEQTPLLVRVSPLR